jgi:hypothetical protein
MIPGINYYLSISDAPQHIIPHEPSLLLLPESNQMICCAVSEIGKIVSK